MAALQAKEQADGDVAFFLKVSRYILKLTVKTHCPMIDGIMLQRNCMALESVSGRWNWIDIVWYC